MPKMKKGVFGVGPKEIAYSCYDGDTVEVSTESFKKLYLCNYSTHCTYIIPLAPTFRGANVS